jgi:hypothetical protein
VAVNDVCRDPIAEELSFKQGSRGLQPDESALYPLTIHFTLQSLSALPKMRPYLAPDKPLFSLSDLTKVVQAQMHQTLPLDWNPPVHARAKQCLPTALDDMDTAMAQTVRTASSLSMTAITTSDTLTQASTPVLSHEQEYIKKLVEDGNSVFYTGSAGQLYILAVLSSRK